MAGIKERLIQVILRGKDLLSPEANKSKKALDELRDSGEKLREELDKAKADNDLVRALDSLSKETGRAEKTIERTNYRVVQLREELNKSPDSKGLETSLKAAEREAAKAQKALDALKVKTADMAEEAKKAGIDTSKLSDEEKRLAAELDKAKGAVSDNTKATKDLQKEQSAAARSAAEQTSRTTSLREALKSTEKRVLGYAAAYISLKAAMSAVRGVTDFVVSGFKSVFASASESEQVLAQLNAALASTEGAIGITADELQRMGLEMRKTSMLSTEQITEMQVALLTYTDIAKEEFPRALQVAIDQQQRLGISITQSAELVGKALQDPSKAMVALGRQGFKLEESQKTLLKQMEDTGRTAEAQAIIMDMLAESYGGSAAAARYGTFKGVWKGITDTFSDFQSKIADSGSFDLVKNKLQGFSDLLTEMEQDGTLDALAVSISSAFEVGAEKVEQFIRSIAKVDFKTLTQDSTDWLNNFSQNIDDAMLRTKLFIAPFRTLFNGITSGISTLALGFLQQVDLILAGVEKISGALPDALGGVKLKESVEGARSAIAGLTEGLVEQIEQDGADIRASWEITANVAVDAKQKEADAVKAAELEKQKAHDDTAKAIIDMFDKEIEAARTAAVEGRRSLEDLCDALKVIDATDSVAELEKLRTALLKAYQEGRISQQEFEQGTGTLNGKIKSLGTASTSAAKDLKSLNGIMEAIAKSANNIDTRAAQQALDKLYKEGKIDADQHAKAQEKLNEKVAELKAKAESSTAAVKEQGKALKETAGSAGSAGAAISDVGTAAEEAGAGLNFFDEILGRVRTPLAEMSAAALDAFDSLQGISKADPSFDTSSLEKTTESFNKSREAVAMYQQELGAMGSRASGFGIWAMETLERGEKVKQSYLSQKFALQQLQRSYEQGTISTKAFADAAASARERFGLLDDSDLSALEGAVEAAKQKMDQLADSTKSTLQSLNDELLQLKGTQEEIEKSKMDSRRRDLQSQLADARKDGDDRAVRNLQQALSTLSEIESERERAARNKKAEDAKAEADKAATAKAPVTQKQEPTKVIKLQLGGQSVDVGVGSAGDEAALLSILEQAGLRSL